jgi:transposase
MSKRGKTRRFTPEFMEQAVRLVQESGRDVKDVAQQLGIGNTTLWRWCTRAEGKEKASLVVHVVETPEEELKRLRKRVQQLEIEKEILKKAAPRSTGHRNKFMKHIRWCSKVQGLSWPLVEPSCDRVEIGLRVA